MQRRTRSAPRLLGLKSERCGRASSSEGLGAGGDPALLTPKPGPTRGSAHPFARTGEDFSAIRARWVRDLGWESRRAKSHSVRATERLHRRGKEGPP